jgi:acetyl-CoA C-acetyltransferase
VIESDVVICEPLRTPVGRFGGVFRGLTAQSLGSHVLQALIKRTGISPDAIDEVIVGNCYPTMDTPAVGRVIALDAGLPVTTTGLQIDRRCGSGLQAVIDAVTRVQTGACDIVVAGGAESMSRAPFYNTDSRFGIRGEAVAFHDALARGRVTAGGVNHPVPGGMLETAENLRRDFAISRNEQDQLALLSQQRAAAAVRDGRFDAEIVEVPVATRSGVDLVSTDEHPRAETTLDALAKLAPIRGSVDPEATVTAGNASGQNDGAALCLVMTRRRADELGIQPFARLVSWAVAGVPPSHMGIGPVPAVAKALARAELTMGSLDLIEINEAFAAQVLACTKSWGFGPPPSADWDRINVNGSGISLGHPVGATGVRILATLLRELERRGGRYGLETMCIGGGQGLAAVFELVT